MWTAFFVEGAVVDFDTANKSNREKFARFFHLMLAEGRLPPAVAARAAFFSAAPREEGHPPAHRAHGQVAEKIAWEFGA